ncbi:MAG: riboflavin synthase [Candidatus Hodgkinia cicadicola]
MFSGVIRNLGILVGTSLLKGGIRLCIISNKLAPKIGDSICCSGVCLTVVVSNVNYFEVEVWFNSLCVSTLSSLRKFDVINLEQVLSLSDGLHGHITNGHIRCVIRNTELTTIGGCVKVKIECPKWISEKLISPSSICLNGMSLTIISAGERWFEVVLIRYSLLNTSFRYTACKCEFSLE